MEKLSRKIRGHYLAVFMLAQIMLVGTLVLYSTAAAHGDDEKAVREALLANASGFERNDLAALNKVWANDESVTVFENGSANYGWADYRDRHLVPEMAEMKNTRYILSDIKPKISGKTAWATFKYSISADLKERHVEGGGLGTAVLEERNGKWQILHWHTSSTRRSPASAPAKKEP